MTKQQYKVVDATTYPRELTDLFFRRVRPLLDNVGVQTRTLEHLLAEAYVLGIKDAVDCMKGDT